ncbi:hypothetical protein PHMEG_00015753 [Phytophthora megakarya]|uniref:Uncharacterized protein n=1 Tax=Phytophthora megakarya TaxID=4795 RepID=A0A225W216_9STRA|nr:hypothetical protein PHMEG_00015753 [Phytophthora megakarya]
MEGIGAEEFFLKAVKRTTLTHDIWVVDTVAGRAISSDRSWFKGSLTPDPSHTFTYVYPIVPLRGDKAEYFEPSKRSECINKILNEYYLAKQGYRHFQSKSGDFLFFIENIFKLPVAIGEVYYLPSVKLDKTKVFSAQTRTFAETLKAWHLRPGHVGKERQIRTISNQKIEGLPNIPYSELHKVAFFCKTVHSNEVPKNVLPD